MSSNKQAVKIKPGTGKAHSGESPHFAKSRHEKARARTKKKTLPRTKFGGTGKSKKIQGEGEIASLKTKKSSMQNQDSKQSAGNSGFVSIKALGKGRTISLYQKIAVSFIILTAILLAIIFYFSFVKVSISLIPNQERLSSNLIIDIYDKSKRSVAGNGVVLGVVKQIEVEQTKSFQASGVEVMGEEVTGKVIIINNYSKNQPLVATTRLLSPDNKLFRLKNTVNVPAGGRIEVEVYADEPSPEAAIGPTHFTIPGLWAGLQDKIYGESKEAMKYSQKVKNYIQQADIDMGVKDLKQSLIEKAKNEVSAAYKDYSQIIYDIDNNSISQRLDGEVGDERDEFSITMKTMVIVVAFNDDEVYQLAQQKLISVLPNDKELLEFNKDDISYNLNNYNINQGMASLNVNFTGKMIIKEGADVIDPNKILGLTSQQLDGYLMSLPEIVSYEIKFTPSWVKKVPNLVDRIKIEIKKSNSD